MPRFDHCYVVVNVETGLTTLVTESASQVAGFMWGKSMSDWTIYKAVRFYGAQEINQIRDKLEER